MEVEILKEALDVARVKKPILPLPSWNGGKDGSQ
jgi:transposase